MCVSSSLNPWESSSKVFFRMAPQVAVAIAAACALYHEQQSTTRGDSHAYYGIRDLLFFEMIEVSLRPINCEPASC